MDVLDQLLASGLRVQLSQLSPTSEKFVTLSSRSGATVRCSGETIAEAAFAALLALNTQHECELDTVRERNLELLLR